MLAKRPTTLPVFGDLRNEIDRLFDRFFETRPMLDLEAPALNADWAPVLDISEKGDHILVKAEIPGVDPSKIEVTVEDDMLTIKGSKEEATEEKERGYYRSERRFGSFLRRVTLPIAVDENKVNATYKDGVLKIELLKDKAALPRKIPVAVAKT